MSFNFLLLFAICGPCLTFLLCSLGWGLLLGEGEVVSQLAVQLGGGYCQ